MSERSIKKVEVIKAVNNPDRSWVSRKNSRNEIFTLDLIRVIRNINNGCILTVYKFGEGEEWQP